MQAGDVIIRLNDVPVTSAVDVKNMIGNLRIGAEVHITLLRAGRSLVMWWSLSAHRVIMRPHSPSYPYQSASRKTLLGKRLTISSRLEIRAIAVDNGKAFAICYSTVWGVFPLPNIFGRN